MSSDHPLVGLETIILIAIGGSLGANARYLIGTVDPGPGGTLIANTLGSYLLGFLLYEALFTDILAERSRVVFGTGFLSSFTTYSTFALETVQSTFLVGAAYVGSSYLLGFGAVLAGRATAARLVGPGAEGA